MVVETFGSLFNSIWVSIACKLTKVRVVSIRNLESQSKKSMQYFVAELMPSEVLCVYRSNREILKLALIAFSCHDNESVTSGNNLKLQRIMISSRECRFS